MKAILNNEQVEISDEQIQRYAMVRKAMSDFQAANPEYDPIQSNADKLINLLEVRSQEITTENLQSAFYALRDELVLRKLAIREADFKGPTVEQQKAAQAAEDARATLIESTHCAVYENMDGREVWINLYHRILDGRDTGTQVKDDVSKLTFLRYDKKENKPIELQQAGDGPKGFYSVHQFHRGSAGKATPTAIPYNSLQLRKMGSEEYARVLKTYGEKAIQAVLDTPVAQTPTARQEPPTPNSLRPEVETLRRRRSNAATSGVGSYGEYQVDRLSGKHCTGIRTRLSPTCHA